MLTGKQKRYLRALASEERAIFQIGHDSLSDNLIEQVSNALEARELVKVSVLKNAPGDLQETAFDLARYTHSELVQVIGRTIVLYRPSDDPEIILP
ncbi:MAG: ribosome assembly RNA-binding protein YhbY [Erysipelotrichaceae bacterium]|nr:ribosome assembly RNA-binding protein YhbY [Erysipelotrichaceae bacterium]